MPSDGTDWQDEGTQISLPAGARVFQPGDPCTQFIRLIKGVVRVDLMAQSGKPLMLYRFGAGESCIMTTSCLLSAKSYNAEAWVEEEVVAMALPQSRFEELLDQSASFRSMVLGSFSDRLAAMMGKIEELTFVSINGRLARRLLEKAGGGHALSATHQDLADDLGTAREVVSRKLAEWEKLGLIKRQRGGIEVLDRGRLERLKVSG